MYRKNCRYSDCQFSVTSTAKSDDVTYASKLRGASPSVTSSSLNSACPATACPATASRNAAMKNSPRLLCRT
jgi:hypothetical protein